jgi:hypothetical protein
MSGAQGSRKQEDGPIRHLHYFPPMVIARPFVTEILPFFFTKTHDPVANHPPSCEHLATSGCDSPVYRSQSRRQKNITRLMTMAAMTLG